MLIDLTKKKKCYELTVEQAAELLSKIKGVKVTVEDVLRGFNIPRNGKLYLSYQKPRDWNIDFRAEIKKLFKKKKLSIPQLAREVELNPQTLYNYLAGRTEMTSGNLEKILELLSHEDTKTRRIID